MIKRTNQMTLEVFCPGLIRPADRGDWNIFQHCNPEGEYHSHVKDFLEVVWPLLEIHGFASYKLKEGE